MKKGLVKLLVLALAVMMILSACGKPTETGKPNNDAQQETQGNKVVTIVSATFEQ